MSQGTLERPPWWPEYSPKDAPISPCWPPYAQKRPRDYFRQEEEPK